VSKAEPSRGLAPSQKRSSRGLAVFESPFDGPTAVMVHGTLDRAVSFSRVARRLDDVHVVAYDRRGYQGSRSVGVAHTIDEHVTDLLSIIETFSPDHPVLGFGHSFGGVVVFAAALARPEAFHHLVLFEPPMPWLVEGSHPHRGVPLDGDSAQETEQFFRRIVSDDAWERMSPGQQADKLADGPALVGDLTIVRMATPFSLEDLQTLSLPITIGVGQETTMLHHHTVSEHVRSTMENVTVEYLSGAGHGAHLTHPDALAELLRRATSNDQESSCASF